MKTINNKVLPDLCQGKDNKTRSHIHTNKDTSSWAEFEVFFVFNILQEVQHTKSEAEKDQNIRQCSKKIRLITCADENQLTSCCGMCKNKYKRKET